MGIAIHLIRDFERQDTGKKKRKRGDGEKSLAPPPLSSLDQKNTEEKKERKQTDTHKQNKQI